MCTRATTSSTEDVISRRNGGGGRRGWISSRAARLRVHPAGIARGMAVTRRRIDSSSSASCTLPRRLFNVGASIRGPRRRYYRLNARHGCREPSHVPQYFATPAAPRVTPSCRVKFPYADRGRGEEVQNSIVPDSFNSAELFFFFAFICIFIL